MVVSLTQQITITLKHTNHAKHRQKSNFNFELE